MRRTAATVALLALAVGALALGLAAAPAGAQDSGNETVNQSENETVVVEVTLSGATATDVTTDDPTSLRDAVATELGVPAERVGVVQANGATTVEVWTSDVTPDELADAIGATDASVDRSTVRPGVSERTQDRVAQIIEGRLGTMNEYNGSVLRVEDERLFVRVTPDPTGPVLDRLVQRGDATIHAQTPDNESSELVTNRDFRQVGRVVDGENASVVAVRFTDDGASRFASELRRLNVSSEGVDACEGNPDPNATGYCLVTSLNGEVTATAGVSELLAETVEFGTFTENEQLFVTAGNATEARAFRLAVLSVPIDSETSVASVDPAEDVDIEENWPRGANDGDDNDSDDGDETPTGTATPNDTTGANTTSSGSSGPGFTPLVGLLGVVTAGLLARRWSR